MSPTPRPHYIRRPTLFWRNSRVGRRLQLWFSKNEKTTGMIKIHHIEGRRSERVARLLEEIGGIPYELDYISGDILGSLLKLEETHETRMAPIVQDGDVTMIESGAILEYLLAKYAKGSPLRPSEASPDFPVFCNSCTTRKALPWRVCSANGYCADL